MARFSSSCARASTRLPRYDEIPTLRSLHQILSLRGRRPLSFWKWPRKIARWSADRSKERGQDEKRAEERVEEGERQELAHLRGSRMIGKRKAAERGASGERAEEDGLRGA